ncbi:MAG: hypothetical protein LQ342_002071 [Letrouitia transgressa]|nr:MAG: hypothetical protein LQ342_002071 [Letrouitia transgressa]
MARPPPPSHPPDPASITLARALSRLETKIVFPDTRLLHSSYERAKTSANLEYARTLLLRLEHQTSFIKIQSKKQAQQKRLKAHRASLKTLTERLQAIEQEDNGIVEFDQNSTDDLLREGDILSASTSPSIPTSVRERGQGTLDSEPLDRRKPPFSPREPSPSSTLRNRRPQSSLFPPDLASATGTSTALHTPAPTTTTQRLESDSSTQSQLTSDLIAMTSRLKSNAQSLSQSLLVDSETLNRAQSSLDKNESSMEAASKRMGLLRRMSEGKGWWGRMMLYAWIAGLWVLAIGLVFLGPKFRF